jgi:quercetin dioxygenase-like cupin family protein
MKKHLISMALIGLATSALAQDEYKLDAMKVFKPDELVWRDNPNFPRGAKIVRLVGDPSKAEVMFISRSKFPPNYKVPPHTHPVSEVVTVISGSLWHSMGEKFDAEKGELLKPGSIFALPAKHAHYVWTTDQETIVQIQGIGPMGITYINPDDDPRKK